MDPQQFNDQLRQSAHAADIKEQRRKEDLSPEARQSEEMEPKMDAAADRAVQKAFQGFTLQNGNQIRCSGSGKNITVAFEPVSGGPGSAPTQGSGGGSAGSGGSGGGTSGGAQWYSLTLCDGTTLDVWAQNIVPP